MKKTLLTFIIFSCISVPSFAMKVITNTEADRMVPSREMGSVYVPAPVDKNIKNGVYVIPGYKAETYATIYKPGLEKDIRKELVGKTWDYPDYVAIKAQYEKSLLQDSKSSRLKKTIKRHCREAADYYYRDTLNNKIVQSGFDIVVYE